MPRMKNMASTEKVKDFKGSLKRLLKEMKPYKFLIIFALILAALGSILSIMAPDKLSSLTDEISKGLVVKSDNLQEVNERIIYNFKNGITGDIIVDNKTISVQDQREFMAIMKDLPTDNNDVNLLYEKIDEVPASIQDVVKPFMNIDMVKKIVAFLAILYILSALFTYLESISMTIVANKFAYKLRKIISQKINKLPLEYFDKHKTGDVLSRITNDVDTIAQSMNQSLSSLVSAITLFIGTVIMMFHTNAIMAVTAITSSLIGFIFMFTILGKSQKYFVWWTGL